MVFQLHPVLLITFFNVSKDTVETTNQLLYYFLCLLLNNCIIAQDQLCIFRVRHQHKKIDT